MAEIRISADELTDPRIDDIINLEQSLRRVTGESVEDVRTPLHLNPIFYYSAAACVGALAVWLAIEPFIDDSAGSIPFVSDFLLFGSVAGVVGLAIGLVYGIANANAKQSFHCGVVGLGVGLGATLLATFVADVLFGLAVALSLALSDGVTPDNFAPHGLAFFVLMCGRGLAWSVVSTGAGLGLGVALKSKKLIMNGLAGGLVGGMLGGILFDPVNRFITGWNSGDASTSRGVGIVCIGLLIGLFIGIFENASKEAWFLMLKGPLAGKQFIVFKNPMVIGSAPKSDIYLFKDPAIDPRHAIVVKSSSKYVLRNESNDAGTFVNGRKVDRAVLQPGDVVTIGDTVLKYHERESR